ncbi:hypothetical protein ERJ75_000755000 [Trypanosoma vivax]|uniref:Uncharacterized protein n=1 Tax=Trypanosoma vivax (strain Y486) TaxID=1055687 RepID=G0U021_TRYVY|nr:hypothetical protein ERJ75_000755000 [Trypanosoma vivax]CCC49418.1 conserved hypothetical protein [Trypanosoma vivax Y486]
MSSGRLKKDANSPLKVLRLPRLGSILNPSPRTLNAPAPTSGPCDLPSGPPSDDTAEQGLKRLIDIATRLNETLTDSTERMLRLRHPLGRVLNLLRSQAHKLEIDEGAVVKRKGEDVPYVPRLVVTGTSKSGKSTTINFLLQCSVHELANRNSELKTEESPNTSGCGVITSAYTSLTQQELSYHQNSGVSSSCNTGENVFTMSCRSRAASGKQGSQTSGDDRVDKCMGVNPTTRFTAGNAGEKDTASSRHRGFKCENSRDRDNSAAVDGSSPWQRDHTILWLESHSIEEDSKCGSLLHVMNLSNFPQDKHRRSRGSDANSPSSAMTVERSVTMKPGAYDQTIVDRIRALSEEKVPKTLCSGNRDFDYECTLPPIPKMSCCGSGKTEGSLPTFAETGSTACRAVPWVLKEAAGGAINSRREGALASPLPDILRGDMFMYTVPCEVIGTQLMKQCITDLFGPFSPYQEVDIPTESASVSSASVLFNSYNAKQHHTKEDNEEARHIRQLIADLTIFVITFADAVLVRESGAATNDPQLLNRPPPMASNLTSLVHQFQHHMWDLYNVRVSPWQMIPYSGTVSSAAQSVLSALYVEQIRQLATSQRAYQNRSRSSNLCYSPSMSLLSSSQTATSSVEMSLKTSADFNEADSKVDDESGYPEHPLQVAIHKYCATVFGERFISRNPQLPLEQLGQIVWHDALESMWVKSGASDLLRIARNFEKHPELHILSSIAVSLVIWCNQLHAAIKDGLNHSYRRVRALRVQLNRMQTLDNAVTIALKQFRREFIPRVISKDIQVQLQERFQRITVQFWWKLVDLVDEAYYASMPEDPTGRSHYVPRIALSSCLSSPGVEIRARLRKEFQQLFQMFIAQDYHQRIALLRQIISEKTEGFCKDSTQFCMRKDSYMENEIKRSMGREEFGHCKSNEALRAGHCTSLECRHHIPFVEDNVCEIKASIESELTLRLARFNTEIINYFMQEVAEALPGIRVMCSGQRRRYVEAVVRVLARLEEHDAVDPLQWASVRQKLDELSRFHLAGMQVKWQLEPFVTKLRASLVEDQILLVLGSSGLVDKCHIACGGRAISYIKEVDQSLRASQTSSFLNGSEMGGERAPYAYFPASDNYFASAKPEVTNIAPDRWLEKITTAPDETLSFSASGDTRNLQGLRPQKESLPDALEEKQMKLQEAKQQHLYGNLWREEASSQNPLWFLLAVWRQVLANMSFRPWLQLHSQRHAALLNITSYCFFTGSDTLRAQLKGELDYIKEMLSTERNEKQRADLDALSVLSHLGTSATAVARSLAQMKGVVMTTSSDTEEGTHSASSCSQKGEV